MYKTQLLLILIFFSERHTTNIKYKYVLWRNNGSHLEIWNYCTTFISVAESDRLATSSFCLIPWPSFLTHYILGSTDPPGFLTHFFLFILLTNRHVIQILLSPSNLSSQNIQTCRCFKYVYMLGISVYQLTANKEKQNKTTNQPNKQTQTSIKHKHKTKTKHNQFICKGSVESLQKGLYIDSQLLYSKKKSLEKQNILNVQF